MNKLIAVLIVGCMGLAQAAPPKETAEEVERRWSNYLLVVTFKHMCCWHRTLSNNQECIGLFGPLLKIDWAGVPRDMATLSKAKNSWGIRLVEVTREECGK